MDMQKTSPRLAGEKSSSGEKTKWQTRRRLCQCLILFLLLTSIIIIKVDLSVFQLPRIFEISSIEQYYVKYPHKYDFIINEKDKCQRLRPFLVLMVPVAPNNRADREIIRSTWGKETLVMGKKVSLFFLLGRPEGERAELLQRRLWQESGERGDLLQSDFLDSYQNLTIKTMVMLEWLDGHCAAASYAMKIDADVFLNVHNLMSMLLNAQRENYLTGLVETEAEVNRDPTSKWYLPVGVFPESKYPPYTLGLGYVFSLDLPLKLVQASRHVKPVYIEDVYLGLCMRYLGLEPTSPTDENYFHVFPVPYNRCAYSKLIATTTEPSIDNLQVWKDFKRPDPFCLEDR